MSSPGRAMCDQPRLVQRGFSAAAPAQLLQHQRPACVALASIRKTLTPCPLTPAPCPLLQLFCCCACSRRGRRRRRQSTAPARWVRVCCSAACLPASRRELAGAMQTGMRCTALPAPARQAGRLGGEQSNALEVPHWSHGATRRLRHGQLLHSQSVHGPAVGTAWLALARSKPGPARRLRAQTLHMTARMHCSAAAGRMVAPAGGYLAVPAGIRLSLAYATHAASNSWGVRCNESSASTPLQRGDRGLGPLYPMALVLRCMGASQGPVPSVSLLGGWLTELLWGAVISASGAEGC